MTIAITYSRASVGIESPPVTVETHISNGLPAFHIVGLPETVVKESKDRVRSAILNSNFEFPIRRITVNLAPADLPKYGGRYDLPIALGVLAASKQIPGNKLLPYEFAGELALSGELRPINGILPFALGTKKAERILILPKENAQEAALINDIMLLPATSLLEVCSYLLDKQKLNFYSQQHFEKAQFTYQDMSNIKGQHQAKRALEIAAAGQHSLLLIGPPGTGKTLLSNCLPGILPPLTETEAVELAAIQSVAGKKLDIENWRIRAFRAPHHSASSFALVGGGNPPRPGEISLAHNGVLFLDELPEFKRQTLESLREPLESGFISISRASAQVRYPAKFQLVAAMNPCPCGQYGNLEAECICSLEQIKKYQARISGPLLDRIDIQAELAQLPTTTLTNNTIKEKASKEVSEKVLRARSIQMDRACKPNALLNIDEIKKFCTLLPLDEIYLQQAMEKKKISARSYFKILKIARTIADLEQIPSIERHHLQEAFFYRHLDRLKKV